MRWENFANDVKLNEFNSQVIELDVENLPDGEEVLNILRQEQVPLQTWNALGVYRVILWFIYQITDIYLQLEYYKQDKISEFVTVFEAARHEANTNYPDAEKDRMRCLDSLAGHYVQMACKEKNKDKKTEYFGLATHMYTAADKIIMYEQVYIRIFLI